ncbi:hypothetical protein [Streptomyces sp. NPDC056227]|uniref:hypothetical protein n=1 Tax=Streptomyces sp. NPDC056227 TaxID=3345753 RepID=UPI0035E02FFF
MSRKTSTKQRPQRPAPKKAHLPAVRAVLPVRPHTDTPPTNYPEFITEGQIKAAYAARLADLPLIPITAWTDPQPNGGIRAYFPGGASLTHTPNGFTAITPCPNGARHIDHITNGHDLHAAAAAAAHCTSLHGQARILTLAEAAATTADTQQLSQDDITTGLINRASAEQPKEHPES